jgi:hypothetical protein
VNNTFDQNSAVKGVVYLDLQRPRDNQSQAQAVIFNNTFDQNFGFYDTTALFVRQQSS